MTTILRAAQVALSTSDRIASTRSRIASATSSLVASGTWCSPARSTIVFNDVSRPEIGFESADNEVTVVERGGEHHLELAPKEEIAEAILDRVDALRARAFERN